MTVILTLSCISIHVKILTNVQEKTVKKIRILGIDPGYAIVGFGVLDYDGHRSVTTQKTRALMNMLYVPLLGAVSCGVPKFAEENIEEYVCLPESLFGRGEFFLLRAKGDSMTGAGIEDGDLVLIRQQSTAEYNQIVVALVDDEATLKRFRPKADHVCLHPENNRYEDIIVDSCLIQGVAVKVIKDLE